MLNQEELEPIQIKSIKVPRRQSIVVNNFFTIITIGLMSVVIIWYVNFVFPQQKRIKEKEKEQLIKFQKLNEKYKVRQKQIELSRKLNE